MPLNLQSPLRFYLALQSACIMGYLYASTIRSKRTDSKGTNLPQQSLASLSSLCAQIAVNCRASKVLWSQVKLNALEMWQRHFCLSALSHFSSLQVQQCLRLAKDNPDVKQRPNICQVEVIVRHRMESIPEQALRACRLPARTKLIYLRSSSLLA